MQVLTSAPSRLLRLAMAEHPTFGIAILFGVDLRAALLHAGAPHATMVR
jgi:hypothetical protein